MGSRATPRFLYALAILFWTVLIIGVLYVPLVMVKFKHSVPTLRILTFGGILDPLYVSKFTSETGIRVELSYYASNEELHAKLKKTGGKGYDLVIPSDYAVAQLRKEGLLKSLDAARMPFLKKLNPLLMNHAFDPGNFYSVPFEWELYGFGYDSSLLKDISRASWDLIFKDPQRYKIIMPNDPIEAVMFAAFYIYGDVESLSQEQRDVIKKLLKAQRGWIEAYSSTRAGYFLATGASPLALTTTAYIFTAHKYTPHIQFVIPQEGSFITIESFAIAAGVEQEDLAYRFMEFMYTPAAAIHHFEEYANLPAIVDEKLSVLGDYVMQFVTMPAVEFQKMKFFKPLMPEEQLRDLWVAVKS